MTTPTYIEPALKKRLIVGLIAMIALVGFVLVVQAMRSPVYVATAEIDLQQVTYRVDCLFGAQPDSFLLVGDFFPPERCGTTAPLVPNERYDPALVSEVDQVIGGPQVYALAAELLSEADYPEGSVAAFIGDGVSTRIRPYTHVVLVSFSAESAELAKEGANSVVGAYRRVRAQMFRASASAEIARIEAGGPPSEQFELPSWRIFSGSLAPTPRRVERSVTLALVAIGVAVPALVALSVGLRYWATQPGGTSPGWWFVGLGLFGSAVALDADALDFGHPGIGRIQLIGFWLAAMLFLLGVVELARSWRADP